MGNYYRIGCRTCFETVEHPPWVPTHWVAMHEFETNWLAELRELVRRQTEILVFVDDMGLDPSDTFRLGLEFCVGGARVSLVPFFHEHQPPGHVLGIWNGASWEP